MVFLATAIALVVTLVTRHRASFLLAVQRDVQWRVPTPAEIVPNRLLQPALLRVYGVWREHWPLWMDVEVRQGIDPRAIVTPQGQLDWANVVRIVTWFRPPAQARTFRFGGGR